MRKSHLVNVILTVITLIAIAGAFTSFQRKRSSFERLDFRFHWVEGKGIIIVDAVDPGSGASASGLRPGDRIWVVGQTPASELPGLKRTLRESGPVRLIVGRGDQTLSLRYTAPDLKVDYRYLFLTFIGFLYLAIGLFTLFRGTRAESLLFYVLTLLAFIVYVYTPAGDLDTTYKLLSMIEEYARIFLPPLTLHFFLRFPRPLLEKRWIIAALYVPPILVTIWVTNLLVLGNVFPVGSPVTAFHIIDRWEMSQFAVYFTLALIALTYTYRTAPVVGQKKQIKWIYLGMAFGFIPFLLLYLVPYIRSGANPEYTSLAVLPLAFIPLAFAVSILKYKLWDVEVIIKEILAYTVTFIFGMVAFSTVNVILTHLIEEGMALERNFLAFASGLLIAGVLVPLKGRIETLVEMVLYRDTYRHRRAIVEFGQELATFRDLHELLEIIRERLAAAVGIDRMNLYVRDDDSFILYSDDPRIPFRVEQSDFAALPIDRPLILDEPRLPDASEIPLQLLRAGYRYVFPLRHRSELKGMLISGAKRGEDRLSTDDLQLVGSLTAPVALAIENSRLYGRLRRQLDEIRSLKEYNENIIESSASAIVVVTADGTVMTANRAFWTLIGVASGYEGTIDRLFPPYRDAVAAPNTTIEMRFTNLQGEEKALSVTAAEFNAQYAPRGTMVLVIVDISERARLERELQQKERLASLGLFAAGIAHEVNTPLTGISSYAQLLLSDVAPDDPKYTILKKMEQQTFRASHLVNNLLDFASNRQRRTEQIDLEDLIRSTVVLHEDLLRAREVRLHLGELQSATVEGDFLQIQQVVTNLLLNAKDAVAREGNIWIDLTVDGTSAQLSVRDDGPGIPPEIQSFIFEPLAATKSAPGGTGLGLAISRRIVRSIGGEIAVKSAPGAGATFLVTLPLSTPSVSPTRESAR
ncbi:MAG: ATP-binding protein [Thermoanaerobaculia bacterium]